MQVTENTGGPTTAEAKRQLQVVEHELEELCSAPGQDLVVDATKQALARVREAVAHLEAAEKRAR